MGGKNSITSNKKPLNNAIIFNKKPLNNAIIFNKKPLSNIRQLFNKKPLVIKGGVLEDSDFEKINELITDKLVHFGLIPAIEPTTIDTGAKESTTIEPVIDAAIEAAMAASIKVNNTGNIPNAVFAKSTIPLAQQISRAEISRLKQQNEELPPLGSSDVYFHMVKITEENVEGWKQFEKKIKEMTPRTLININAKMYEMLPIDSDSPEMRPNDDRAISINAGLDHFNIRVSNTFSDLFVVYASKELNKTNLPPDWKDVEIMVTVLAKEGVPFVTQMGIVKLAHTYTRGAFGKNLIDINPETNNIDYSMNPELFEYLKLINFKYPSHSYISLYLFTFIGTHIYQFFSDKKTALFTSPTNTVSSIVTRTLKKYKLPYGYEREEIRHFPNYIVKLNLSNDSRPFLSLSRDNLKKLCPWYCNIFTTIPTQTAFPKDEWYSKEYPENNFNYAAPENTQDCYNGPEYQSPFLYVPIYSFNQLVERGVYQFEPIE